MGSATPKFVARGFDEGAYSRPALRVFLVAREDVSQFNNNELKFSCFSIESIPRPEFVKSPQGQEFGGSHSGSYAGFISRHEGFPLDNRWLFPWPTCNGANTEPIQYRNLTKFVAFYDSFVNRYPTPLRRQAAVPEFYAALQHAWVQYAGDLENNYNTFFKAEATKGFSWQESMYSTERQVMRPPTNVITELVDAITNNRKPRTDMAYAASYTAIVRNFDAVSRTEFHATIDEAEKWISQTKEKPARVTIVFRNWRRKNAKGEERFAELGIEGETTNWMMPIEIVGVQIEFGQGVEKKSLAANY